MNKHTPRRSGVGPRQVIAPKRDKDKRRRPSPVGPELCGVAHPEAEATCARSITRTKEGERVEHSGQHRVTPLVGITYRWVDAEAAEEEAA